MLAGDNAGILVDPGNAAALAEGLLMVLSDKDRAQAMRQATARVRERYYWDRLVSDFVKVYAF
jgi:glycosyltransferase involved in cell wall biosynthesis